MKYLGQSISEQWSKEVEVLRPDGSHWRLKLQPLSLGFPQWLHERGVLPPAIPTKVSRKDGGKIKRDAGGRVQFEQDISQADFQLELSKYQMRVALLAIWQGLQAEATLQFESAVPSGLSGWLAFADQIGNELEEAGFTLQDILFLCEHIHQFQDHVSEHLQESRQRFFSTGVVETN